MLYRPEHKTKLKNKKLIKNHLLLLKILENVFSIPK